MKKRNRTLVVLSVCACAAFSAGVFAACGDESAHTAHDYGDWVVTNPTDENTGTAVKTCNAAGSCEQKTVTVILPVLGDDAYSVSVDSAATCVDAGETTYTLSNDGDPISFAVTTPATGHGTLEYTPASTPSLHKACTAAHWSCLDCETLFSDAEGTTEIESVVIIPAEHPLTSVEEAPATCTETGKLAHYYCEACDKSFEDENGDEELSDSDLTILALGHRLTSVKETPATCYGAGEIAHYHCGVCGNDYADVAGDEELSDSDLTIDALDHNLSKVETQDPTCTADGFEEYWLCKNCNDLFCDAEGSEKLDLIQTIPAIGHHTWSEYPMYNEEKNCFATQCSVCHEEKDEIPCSGTVTNGTLTGSNVKLGAPFYVSKTNGNSVANVTLGLGSYKPSETGIYEISFTYLDNRIYTPGTNSRTGAVGSTTIFSVEDGSYVVNDALKDNVKPQFDELGRLTKLRINVDGTTIATNIAINIAVTTANKVEAGATVGCLICVSQPNKLYFGDNTVQITAAGATADDSKDTYTFVPTETKAYSITVPAGVDAILSTGEEVKGGDSGDYINFNATAGQPITVTFLALKVGSYNVTIGETGNYMFTPDISYTGLNVPAKKQDGDVISGGVTVLEVGDIEEGTYIITVTVSAGLGRSSLFFGVNPTSTDYLTFTGVAANGNYSTQNYEGLADVIFYTGIQYDRNNCASFNATNRYVFKVTVQLKKGDTLVFAHTGTTDGSVSVSMEAVPNED